MNSLKHKLLFIISLIVFRAVLDFSYLNSVSKIFEYEGFEVNFNIYNYLISWCAYLFCSLLISDYLKQISDYFFITFVVFLIAPISSIAGFDYQRSAFVLLITIVSFLIVYFITYTRTIKISQLPYVKSGPSIAFYLSLFAVLLVTLRLFTSDITFNFNFERVYEFREDNNLAFGGPFFSYVTSWTYQIFNMFLIAFFLMKKNYLFVFIFVIFQIFFFGAVTQKEIIFFPAILLFSWYFFRKTKSLLIFPIACSLVLLFSIALDSYFETVVLSGLFSRRLFYVPANLSYVYYEFFSLNEYAYWSNSFLKYLFSSVYPEGIPRAIGEYMNSLGSMNNGYVSSGYAQAGFFGVLLYSVIIGFILKMVNYFSYKQIPLWLSIAILFAPLRSLIISADLFTTLLTHGLIMSLLILFLARKDQKKIKE